MYSDACTEPFVDQIKFISEVSCGFVGSWLKRKEDFVEIKDGSS